MEILRCEKEYWKIIRKVNGGETSRKYMNWAQIKEREIKESNSERNKRKNSKGSGGRMEKKNSLGIYKRFKKELKEEDYSGSLESMVWLRARTNQGENSWQRNR